MIHKGKCEKAGIVTLYYGNHNFGGLLQAFALPTALDRYLGISAEQIAYQCKPSEPPKTKKEKPVSLYHRLYYYAWVFVSLLKKKNLQKRLQAFEEFIEDIPHSEHIYNCETISGVLRDYTQFICGGDQIWNDYQQLKWYHRMDSEVFTLQFVPEYIKKVSYAPSMGVLTLTDEFKTDFQKAINRLDTISLREKRAVPVLRELTNKPIAVTVDPVLLLEEADWIKVMRHPQIGQKYIVCYLLGDYEAHRKAVKAFSSKTKLKTVTFPHILRNDIRKCDLFFGDIHNYNGPREFLGLIQNAEMVITDSFHACVFSMMFQTPFVVFERHETKLGGNLGNRIYDFLEEYHLKDQLVTEEALTGMQGIPQIDFSYAHDHWKKRRKESLEYLEHALKDYEIGAEQ